MERLRRRLVGRWYRAIYRSCDAVATCSDAVRREVSTRQGVPIDAAKIETIRNGIELEPFAVVGRTGSRTGRFTLACVSNFAPFKGHEVLVEALGRLGRPCPVRCQMVGDGPTRARIEQLVLTAGMEDTVEFLGCRDDVPMILRQADVLVLPSHWEPFGLVVVEAMAAGVPVVATAAGGVPEIITDGYTGLLVPPGDPQAMAAAIGRMLNDEPLRRRLAAQAAQAVRAHFTAEAMARAYEAWYLRLARAPQQEMSVEGAHVG
jgi:glycosyltransferase involved in cell wall biosynthesis